MAKRVLVINDTQEVLELFRLILEPEGYEVILYSYAIHDLKEFERLAPDIIIVDFFFSEAKEGWQMVQKLKMSRSTTHIPLIVCTAADRAVKDIEGYLQAKNIALVPKPFDVDDLLEAITKALDVHPHRSTEQQSKKYDAE